MAKSKTEIRRYSTMLPVPLTDAEKRELGAKLAISRLEAETQAEDARAARKKLNDEKKKIDEEIGRLAHVINQGVEEREVEVLVRHAGKGKVEEIRTDTDEVIDTRSITDDEAQGSLLEENAA